MAEPNGVEMFYGAAIYVLRRRFRKWGQRKLAKKAKVARSSISNYEQGKTVPSLEVCKKIAGALRVSLARLLRLAAVIQEAMNGLSRDSQGIDSLAWEVTFDLAADFRRGALPLILKLLSSTRREEHPASPQELRALSPLVDRLGAEGLQVLSEELPELKSPAFVEFLGQESERAAADDADRALELARLTLWLAERMPTESRRQCEVWAWALLGNARRVRNDLKGAKKAFAFSTRLLQEEGPGAPVFLACWRLFDLEASLCIDLRQPGKALALLDQAAEAAPQDGAFQARLLSKRSNALAQLGDAEGAIAALERAQSLLDLDAEPRLLWILRFNLMESLCEVGRAAETEGMLGGLRALTAQVGNGLDDLRLRWLEAKIAAGVGRPAEAIEALSRVRADLAKRTLRADEALASMELAALYLEQGRTADVKALVRQMETVFQDQGIHEEAQKALKLFRQAVELETVTLGLVRRIVAYLYQAQHNPELRFEATSE